MNQLVSSTLGVLFLCVVGCAKKDPKPMRTEPWLAHSASSVATSPDAALPLIRYALGERSVIRFELPTKRGALSGELTRVSGELEVDVSDLARSRGRVRVDLDSLVIHAASPAIEAALLERARLALELTPDAGSAEAIASFELTSLEDASPARLEASPERDAGSEFTRRTRGTAVGNLLLHGFRLTRRAPLEAEFGFDRDRLVPKTVVIRSRAPFVVSLETHGIRAPAAEGDAKGPTAVAPSAARDIRVSVELYGTKVD